MNHRYFQDTAPRKFDLNSLLNVERFRVESNATRSNVCDMESIEPKAREAKCCYQAIQHLIQKTNYQSAHSAVIIDAVKSLRRLSQSEAGRKGMCTTQGLIPCIISVLDATWASLMKRAEETQRNHDLISSMWMELFIGMVQILRNMALSSNMAEKHAITSTGGIISLLQVVSSPAIDVSIRFAACGGLRGLCEPAELRGQLISEGIIPTLFSAISECADLQMEGMICLIFLLELDAAKVQTLEHGMESLQSMILESKAAKLQLMASAALVICLDGSKAILDQVVEACGVTTICAAIDTVLRAAEYGQVNLSTSGAFRKLMVLLQSRQPHTKPDSENPGLSSPRAGGGAVVAAAEKGLEISEPRAEATLSHVDAAWQVVSETRCLARYRVLTSAAAAAEGQAVMDTKDCPAQVAGAGRPGTAPAGLPDVHLFDFALPPPGGVGQPLPAPIVQVCAGSVAQPPLLLLLALSPPHSLSSSLPSLPRSHPLTHSLPFPPCLSALSLATPPSFPSTYPPTPTLFALSSPPFPLTPSSSSLSPPLPPSPSVFIVSCFAGSLSPTPWFTFSPPLPSPRHDQSATVP